MKFRNGLAAVVLIAILAAAGYAAQWLTLLGWNAVVKYDSPYARALPSGSGGTALTGRVVLIVVDGLRVDASERMTVVNTLRARGASFTAWTGEPSLSLPGWTAIASGAGPEVSGVTTNWYEGLARVDTLFAAAKRAGVSTAVAGSPGWVELFGTTVDEHVVVGDPNGDVPADTLYRVSAEVADGAAGMLRSGQAALVLVHFPSVDLVGHRFGGASPEYAEAVRRVDDHIGTLLALLDLSADTVIVTSDHGHLDQGGHGGWEPIVKRVPLVLAGRAVHAGTQFADVRQIDLAPTVAALLGIPIPAHNQGRPLAEAIDADPSVFGPRWIDQQRTFYQSQAEVLESDAPAKAASDPRVSEVLAAGRAEAIQSVADDLARTFYAAREERLERERARRLPIAVAAALLPLIGIIWLLRRRLLERALVGTAVFFVIDYAMFYGRGYAFSLSVFNSESQILAFFNQRLIDAALAMTAGALIAGVLAARRRPADAFLGALGVGYLTACVIVLQVVYFYWQWDIRFAWYLPDLALGFKYYLDLLMVVPVGFLAGLYGIAALVARVIARVVIRPQAET
ncbi:MAG TPA: alkaline phosphatase family protein [bacterium]|jgi:hypothetical protein